jgi:hypothetical protein
MRVILVLGLALGGCLPFAVPPLRASVGAGGAAGDVPVHTPGGVDEVSGAERVEARVGLSAMTWRPARPVDVTAGWIGSWTSTLDGDARDMRHGGFAEVNWFGYGRRTIHSEWARGWRGGPSATVEVLDDLHGGVGGGGSIGMMVEGFVYGTSDSSCDGDGCVWATGESAIGVAARAGARAFEEGAQLYVVVSLEMRIPALIGFVWLSSH